MALDQFSDQGPEWSDGEPTPEEPTTESPAPEEPPMDAPADEAPPAETEGAETEEATSTPTGGDDQESGEAEAQASTSFGHTAFSPENVQHIP